GDGPARGPGSPAAAAQESGGGNAAVGAGGGGTAASAGGASGFAAAARSGFAALQGLLAKRRTLLAKLRPGRGDERARAPLPADDVLSALKRPRSSNPKQNGVSEVRQNLRAQARQLRGAPH